MYHSKWHSPVRLKWTVVDFIWFSDGNEPQFSRLNLEAACTNKYQESEHSIQLFVCWTPCQNDELLDSVFLLESVKVNAEYIWNVLLPQQILHTKNTLQVKEYFCRTVHQCMIQSNYSSAKLLTSFLLPQKPGHILHWLQIFLEPSSNVWDMGQQCWQTQLFRVKWGLHAKHCQVSAKGSTGVYSQKGKQFKHLILRVKKLSTYAQTTFCVFFGKAIIKH